MRCIALTIAALLTVLLLPARLAQADGLIVIPESTVIVPGHFTFAPLEVTYHKVSCDIHDQVAVTSVDQEFYNPNNARLEGDYIFPIPVNAQIDKFTMDINGKMVDAELLSADKARKIYEDIVRKARDPALLEYAGRAMFRVHIFPIEPNSKKRIQLKYTELLKQDNGLLDYHYTLNTEKYSSRPLQNVSIQVNIASTAPLTTLYSPTHEVDIKRKNNTTALVSYEAQNVRPDTDFHLFIGRKQTPVGLSLVTYRPDAGKDGYFALLAAPTFKDATHAAMPKDVVFVIDTSGSMSGPKIEQARQALKFCINTLNPDDRFDIVRFSTEAEPLFGSLSDASADHRKKATELATSLTADGGTAIDEALKKAIAERPASRAIDAARLFMVVFMTDGEPTIGEENPDVILAHVKEESNGAPVRIFSFGVGTDVNTKLLDGVAEQTRGYSQYVLPNENLELAMSTFWGKVQDPVLANLKLDTGTIAINKLYPKELPDLFKGDQIVAFGTYSTSGHTAITLTGTINGQSQTFSEDVSFDDQTDSSKDWIAKLWATRRIGYLLDDMRLHGENKELKDEIVELARHWGVVTPYTAMLIIEDEKSRNVPVAVQSLREMSADTAAATVAGGGIASLRSHSSTGNQSVKDSLNTNEYKAVTSMSGAVAAADQTNDRDRFDGQVAGAMQKQASPASLNAPAGTGGSLNLGFNTTNGWQSPTPGEPAAHGYRVISSYAQQTRIINNRSFFLNGNQWTDAAVQKNQSAKRSKIIFNSDDYFALLAAHPEAAPFLSLGNNVTLSLGETIYDITEESPAK